ncbi:hypothetical protein FACS18942_05900 [Planctomycetales bacterium]|nr:hypothetical protein FACS18942_05900 [Planctomycetales bacterium]
MEKMPKTLPNSCGKRCGKEKRFLQYGAKEAGTLVPATISPRTNGADIAVSLKRGLILFITAQRFRRC